MPTIDVQLRRHSVVSTKPFAEVVSRLTATIGRPDMQAFHRALTAATRTESPTWRRWSRELIGSSGLMELIRFDAGEVLRKERGGRGPEILRLVVGNPLIMKEMAKAVPDAAAVRARHPPGR